MKTFVLLSSVSAVLGQKDTCADMGGYNCDQYAEYYDCGTLEGYGWKCDGCACTMDSTTKGPSGDKDCHDMGGYNCDQYTDSGYTCDTLETNYGWDCSSCKCGKTSTLGEPQEPSDEDLKVWSQTIDAQDTLQTRDADCAYPTGFDGLKSMGQPSQVRTGDNGEFKFIFPNGATVELTQNYRQQSIKITCYVAGSADYTTAASFPWDIQLTEEQYNAAAEAFESHDQNGDGTLTPGGAYTALHTLTPDVPEDMLESLANWDNNGDGSVDFDEFLHMYDYILFVSKAYESFTALDTNGDGSISTKEIKPALTALGLPSYLADELIAHEDVDKNGSISFDEYLQMLQDEQQFLGGSSTTTRAGHADSGTALTETDRKLLSDVFDKFDSNGDATLSQPEWRELLMLADAYASVDNDQFRDEHGYTCSDWKNYDCSKATSFGYTQDGQSALIQACPSSCPKCQVKNRPQGDNADGTINPRFLADTSPAQAAADACMETQDGSTYKADSDCCGLLSETKCAEGFTYSQGLVCYPDKDGRGIRYTTVCVNATDPDTAPEGLECVFEELIHEADQNRDGNVDRNEFIDMMQLLKERVSANDFQKAINAIQAAMVPDCYTFTTCDECTRAKNANLCGWNQVKSNWGNGGYYTADGGIRSRVAERKLQYGSYYYGETYGWCVSMDEDQMYANYYNVELATSAEQCDATPTRE